MSMEDVSNDFPLDSVNVSEWYDVCDVTAKLFAGRGYTENDEYHISSERGDAYTVHITLLRLDRLLPQTVLEVAEDIRTSLRGFSQYWQVHVNVMEECKTHPLGLECLTWLEIDKYEIYHYFGKVVVQRCKSLEEFYERYWGKSTGRGFD
jgi:hypothetical protein